MGRERKGIGLKLSEPTRGKKYTVNTRKREKGIKSHATWSAKKQKKGCWGAN